MVVIYKIDRLSRSLMDISKLVEVFDRNGVTFVSVTQSFNTTTSMGRLTLNILLSFAQFEREVTAERIRDKVRASRMTGMWMHQRQGPVIGRHGAVLLSALRLRLGLRHRIISRTGRTRECGNPLKMRGRFASSRDRRGALKERHGPFGDPFLAKRPVSEGRKALPTPFETKRKKTPIGALRRIQR